MFHGGTNFGFTNGANDKGNYVPIVTSYDYDAPLDEAGNPTAKYWAMRDVIAKHARTGSAGRRTGSPSPLPETASVPDAAPAPTLETRFAAAVPLWRVADAFGEWGTHEQPPTADALGHYRGFTLYRTEAAYSGEAILQVEEVRDRAQVFCDRRSVGVLARDHRDCAIVLPDSDGGRRVLELLVEDQGRVDYGRRIGEPKGLIGPVSVNGEQLTGWQVLPLDLGRIEPAAEALRALDGVAQPEPVAGPAFARAVFDLDDVADLFLDTAQWGKGVAWINGFCLGRYWSRGPQRTLYVPAPVLRREGNELIVLELHATRSGQVAFLARPELGHTEF